MPTPILMPALSPTMEEGKLAKWLVSEGQKVRSGDVIAEIETDKATMEVEAVDEGTVGKIIVPAGTEGVKVNSQIAVLLGEGENVSDIVSSPVSQAVPVSASRPAAVAPPTAAPAIGGNGKAVRGTGMAEAGSRLFATPLARRIARERGIDLSSITGSGPNGRVVKADVEAADKPGAASSQRSASAQTSAFAMSPAAFAPQPSPLAVSSAMPQPMADDKIIALYEPGTFDIVPLDNMRKTIAKRLVESKVTIPHFYLTVDCRLDELLAARERLNLRSPKEGPGAYKLSVNDFAIKALALALREVPGANATWTSQGILRHKRIDVGVAVAVEGGLFTPVIRHADLKTLSEISNEMKDLAARARARKLAPAEYQGGTTSISNLGMYGIKHFDAVINPPHASILAMGAGEERPIARAGKLEVATMVTCTLSCDHRVVDGALGARFLNAFKGFIEDPVRMLI
jgi:pyruvate dehydrogenase E2 component (dihydrolipoamide acetyltransferase)